MLDAGMGEGEGEGFILGWLVGDEGGKRVGKIPRERKDGGRGGDTAWA